MIKVVTKFIAKNNEVENIKEVFAKIIPSIRKEDGNISYHLFQDVKSKNELTLIEEWKSKETLDSHMQTRLLQNALGQIEKHVVDINTNFYQLLI
ncbi:MAG: putative quinol monooxygenase [Sedimentibacter sp.]